MNMVVTIQVTFICCIALLAFISGIVPTKLPWCKNSIHFLGIANAFSGGVFIAIAFMHIIPEAFAEYDTYVHSHKDSEDEFTGIDTHYSTLTHGDEEDEYFPLPCLLVAIGYSFMLLIEKVIFDTHKLTDSHRHSLGCHKKDWQGTLVNSFENSFERFQSDLSRNLMNNDANKMHDLKKNEDLIKY